MDNPTPEFSPLLLRIGAMPALTKPVVIAAFEGWNDAGSAASRSLKYLVKALQAERFATIDPEPFYVFSEHRPTVRVVRGKHRGVRWPTNEFYYGRDPANDQDVVLFLGTEPDLKWRTYVRLLMDMLRRTDASLSVTLGAYLSDSLHSDPVGIQAVSHQVPLEEGLAPDPISYQGQTGIVGVLTGEVQRAKIPMLALWAAIPYYISIPNPKGAHTLLTHLAAMLHWNLELSNLGEEAGRFDRRVAQAISSDPGAAQYVKELRENKKREVLN